MERLNTAPHDPVAELLATLRVRSTVYCLSELREPWGFEVDGTDASLSKAFKREFGISPGRYREGNGRVAVSPLVDR